MRQKQRVFSLFLLSPSSRRAWIEMAAWVLKSLVDAVALLAEGVDRNAEFEVLPDGQKSRPPRGGRG